MSDGVIRIVLADDQDLIRGGLRAILDVEDDIEVVAEASDGAAAATAAEAQRADIVLMDVQMPGVDGLEGTRRVVHARPGCRVLMLTMFDLDVYVFAALRAGASGFLLKTTAPAELAAAIRACHSGELLFAPTVTRRLVEAYVSRPPQTDGVPPRLHQLTDREVDVLRAIARGRAPAMIVKDHTSQGRDFFHDHARGCVQSVPPGRTPPRQPGRGRGHRAWRAPGQRGS